MQTKREGGREWYEETEKKRGDRGKEWEREREREEKRVTKRGR